MFLVCRFITAERGLLSKCTQYQEVGKYWLKWLTRFRRNQRANENGYQLYQHRQQKLLKNIWSNWTEHRWNEILRQHTVRR